MNVSFNYLYRDAGNYKSWGSVVFRNPDDLGIAVAAGRLGGAFDSGCLFIAGQVGIGELFFDDKLNEDDHCFHEFDSLEPTNEPATDQRSFGEFVSIVERESKRGWQAFDRLTRRG